MNLTPLGANQTELELSGGLTVLFSYRTPVACKWTNGLGDVQAYRTEKKWSPTTTRHINSWIDGDDRVGNLEVKPQQYFDDLLTKGSLR